MQHAQKQRRRVVDIAGLAQIFQGAIVIADTDVGSGETRGRYIRRPRARLKLIDELLEKDPGATKDSDLLDDIGWDSLAAVSFQALAGEKFDQNVSPTDLMKCTTVADLAALVGVA